jgi:hypothetical protein
MKRLALVSMFLSTTLLACSEAPGEGVGEDLDGDGKADTGTPSVSNDNLNGMWRHDGTTDVIESWSAIGIRLHLGDKVLKLTRTGNKLKGEGVALEIEPNGPGPKDDSISGTIDGADVSFDRAIEIKDTLELKLPGDRSYRSFLNEQLAPLAQQDRESYVVMDADKITRFMESTVLFQAGSFQRKYMKGANAAERDANFRDLIRSLDGMETTPRSIISDPQFTSNVKSRLKDDSLAGLALVNFNLYFTTGAGRAIHLPLADDALAYFITDRPSRAEKLGLVVMDTPSHGPLASTFGRQLLDMGEMPPEDSQTYAKAMIELLAKSDASSVAQLSGVGKSALVDWYAVMAIEDYRVITFSNPSLGWGYNMTNVQFFGLVARALGNQVIVGSQLRPGDPSYADVLNGGNDMQEFQDMFKLKSLTTQWLRAEHPDAVAAVETAFADIVPKSELDSRAKADVFHFICANLYDNKGRTSKITGATADNIIGAVTRLYATIESDKAALEAFILSHGITKSSTPAPKSTGF